MSTKIYEAYRCKLCHLDKSIDFLQDKFIRYAHWKMKSYTEKIKVEDIDVVKDVLLHGEWPLPKYLSDEVILEYFKLSTVLCGAYHSSIISRHYFNFDSFLKIYVNSTYAFIIPSAPYEFKLGKLGSPYLEDYSYWNNSDHPEEITWSNWCARGKCWDNLLEKTPMIIDILDFKESLYGGDKIPSFKMMDFIDSLDPYFDRKKHLYSDLSFCFYNTWEYNELVKNMMDFKL